jgi:hypothetical protein
MPTLERDEVQVLAACSICRRECCNCPICLQAKGRANICAPCRRAEVQAITMKAVELARKPPALPVAIQTHTPTQQGAAEGQRNTAKRDPGRPASFLVPIA